MEIIVIAFMYLSFRLFWIFLESGADDSRKYLPIPSRVGHYHVGAPLFSSGEFYEGYDHENQRDILIKFLPVDLVYRSLNYIEKNKSLCDFKLIDQGFFRGGAFLIFETFEGISLKETLDKLRYSGNIFSMDLTLKIFLEIGENIKKISSQGLMTGGFSPENIFCNKHDKWSVDYWSTIGSTKLEGPEMAYAAIRYQAPEIVRGSKTFDPRSDVYTLGAILYEMLVLVPWNITSSGLGVLEKNSIAPSEVRTNLVKKLDEVVLKALEFEKEDRFDSVESFLKAVEEFCDFHCRGWKEIETGNFLEEIDVSCEAEKADKAA
ncbi:MAG: hypothetical protein HOE90_00490 [Bacteriovoracaceae bacterium]|jgi:serine/threonine protein kinase|nr:hypothetical protein [Bacteriovoracaceae bacterium]